MSFACEVVMKIALLFTVVFFALNCSFAQTSFCIAVNDQCCDINASIGSHQLNSTDSFTNWYIFYDTGSPNNKVNVVAYLDGVQVWQILNLCGCGSTSVSYPTSGQHLISISVQCKDCNGTCDAGSASVDVYTPSTNGCHGNCEKN